MVIFCGCVCVNWKHQAAEGKRQGGTAEYSQEIPTVETETVEKPPAGFFCIAHALHCPCIAVLQNYGVILLPEGLIEFIPEIGSLISEVNDLLAAGLPPTDEALLAPGKLTPKQASSPSSPTTAGRHIWMQNPVCFEEPSKIKGA